jgi:hypothetical protein
VTEREEGIEAVADSPTGPALGPVVAFGVQIINTCPAIMLSLLERDRGRLGAADARAQKTHTPLLELPLELPLEPLAGLPDGLGDS